jgi:hypothetical protein
MATPTPSPAPSSIDAALGALGSSSATPSLTAGGLPNYATPGARNVITSTNDPTNTTQPLPTVAWNLGGPPGTGLAGLANLATNQQAGLTGGTMFYSERAAIEAYTKLPPDQKAAIQRQLLSAGFYEAASTKYYGSATGPATEKPNYGAQFDMDTITALQAAFAGASAVQLPLDQVLNQSNAAAMSAAQIYQQSTQVGQFDQSDPAELRGLADQQAVSTLGRKATDSEKALAVSMVQGAQVAYQKGKFEEQLGAKRGDLASQLAGGVTAAGAAGGPAAVTGATGDLNAFMQATGGQESGGGYGAVNAASGAAGKYQIMPGNWSSWAQAAGIGANAPQTPTNQEIVSRNQMAIYYNDLKDWGAVAVAWYAGEGTAKAFLADPTNPKWQVPQAGGNPSIYDYAKSVVGKMNAISSAPGTTTSALGVSGNAPAGQTPTVTGPEAGYTGGALETGSIGVTAGTPSTTLAGTTPGGTTTAAGPPSVSQLLPSQESTYTQVNPTADIAELLRRQNPQGAGAHDIATVLDNVRTLFHG